jgi:DNA-directed RNA polymerase specialized sigma24 family protein
MARDEQIHARLLAWAQYVTVGDGSGFPTMSVLHPHWQPPSPGTTPSMKVSAPSGARQTHRAIARLSRRQANTLVVHYVLKLPIELQADRLQCAVPTVYARVEAAQRELRAVLSERDEQKTFCNIEKVG